MLSSIIQLFALLSILHIQRTLAISFPPPTGPYNTSIQNVQLIDKSRIDPLSPISQLRKLMISIFTPHHPSICNPSLIPYMDTQTATFEDEKFSLYGLPPGLFSSLELQVCSLEAKPSSRHTPKSTKHPVIIFSPALGTTRLFYSVLAQQAASAGFIVITVDHPYDVDIVTFPDDSTTHGIDIPDEALPSALDTRVQDISFVINQLARPSFAKHYFPAAQLTCNGGLDVSRVGVFGHSFGGAAAAEAMLYDSRLTAGINLDGTFFGQVVLKGLKNPFLIFAHEGKNRTNDPSWETIWPKLTGWKRESMLNGSKHYTFSDLPVIANVLGFGDKGEELLGRIDGGRAKEVVTAYVEGFFQLFLRGKKTGLFDGSSSKYPEVSFAIK